MAWPIFVADKYHFAMKTTIKLLGALAMMVMAMPSCTKLNRGDSFKQTIGGIEYRFEVIVSKMRYVSLTPVSGPTVVVGALKLPAKAEYDGDTYVVTQIGEEAFKNYTGLTSVVLPTTTTDIDDEAFAGCTSLVSLDMPKSVSTIGDEAFAGCVALSDFSFDASVSTIGEGVFKYCTSLTSLEFTPTFTAVPDELCYGCSGLTSIDLPSTILSIGEEAFAGCTGLEKMSCMAGAPPKCESDAFTGVDYSIPLTVQLGSASQYSQAPVWCLFTNIYEK